MKNKLFHLDYYLRCGEMPLYLIFYRSHAGRPIHSVMLCTTKNLKLLLKKRKGFSDPRQYGHVVYSKYEEKPSEELIAMLKSRYYFDLPVNQESLTEA